MISYAPRCQRRSPLLSIVLMSSLIAALILLVNVLCRHANGSEIDYQRAATVLIRTPVGTGSGVCVSQDGVIITAGHVIYKAGPAGLFGGQQSISMPKAVEVTFPGRQPEAARVLTVSKVGEPADLAVLQCSGNDYPQLDLAERSPAVGDDVVTLGYPAGMYCRLEGKVTYVGLTTDKSHDAITAKGRPNPGHSGGPLIDSRGDVVGITSAATYDAMTFCGKLEQQPQLGFYTRVEQVHSILASRQIKLQQTGNRRQPATRSTVRLKIKIFAQSRTIGRCKPCDRLKDDIERGRIKVQGRVMADVADVTWCYADEQPEAAAAAGVTQFPTVVCDDGDRIENYTTAEDFAARVSVKINLNQRDQSDAPLFGALPGEPPPPAVTPTPKPDAAPQQADDSVPDEGNGIKVVVLLKQQNWGVFDSAVPAIEAFAKKGFANRIKSAIGSKCDVVLCLQRTNHERYDELMSLTGADEEKAVSVIVLAPKVFTGLIGVLVEKIETVLKTVTDKDWKYANVQPVFERTDPDNYQAVVDGLANTESTNEPAGGVLAMILASIGGMIGLTESVVQHRAKAA